MIEKFNFKWDILEIKKTIKDKIACEGKGYICVINANILIFCYKTKNFNEIIENSVFNICDGINVKRINNIANRKKIEVLPGPDLFEILIEDNSFKQYYLGGEKDVLNGLKRQVQSQNAEINDNMFYSPPFLPVDKFNYEEIAERINTNSPDIIWVGLGAPKQEEFMKRIVPFLNKGILIGVGAAFNFYSGIEGLKRAPKLLRRMRVEWLYRLLKEPRRIFPRQIRSAYYLPKILFNEFLERYRVK